MPTHLHLDPFSGIAGDMVIGALLDLGASLDTLRDALEPLPISRPYELTARRVQRQSVGGIDFKVMLDGEHEHPHSHEHTHTHQHEHNQPHSHSHTHTHADSSATHSHTHSHTHTHAHARTTGGHAHAHTHSHEHHENTHTHSPSHRHHHHTGPTQILAMIDAMTLTDRGKDRARRVVNLLAQAEAKVHGMSVEDVHFHEVGAVDSIVDMLGTAVLLEELGVDTLSCGPLPLGRGFVRCDHGTMPLPAPATAYLLRSLPTFGTDRTDELVTPTGAALAAGLCTTFGPQPAMTLKAVGYGAGDRDTPGTPNLLRAMLGEIT